MSSRLFAVLLFVVVSTISTACGLLPGAKTPAPTASPPPSSTPAPTTPPSPTVVPPASTPSQTPAPSAATSDFYLRAWYTQSLPPQYTFSWLPPTTISDGVYLNGNVAVPAIYPGPLIIIPFASTITDAGIAQIVSEATRLGLLGDETDFTGDSAMPGAKLGQIEITADGKTRVLTGNPDLQIVCITTPCEGAPGSPEAFAAFWRNVTALDMWLPDELGKGEQYVPERVALLLTETDIGSFSPPPTIVAWPLDVPLTDADCVTLEGTDLATMLPVLQAGTQLTIFGDGDTYRQPTVRVLVPGEPSPCEA